MKKTLLPALIASLFAVPALAFAPFTVKDIRVEGIQRTEAGTVFSYLPVKVGDTLDDDKAAQSIKALFSTGFFKASSRPKGLPSLEAPPIVSLR